MDDASGAGILDNVLLPFVALGFVATRLMMDAPAGSKEITQAWNEVVDAFADTGQIAGSEVLQAVDRIPPMDNCTEHYALCLMTPLGRRNSGGLWVTASATTAQRSAPVRLMSANSCSAISSP